MGIEATTKLKLLNKRKKDDMLIFECGAICIQCYANLVMQCFYIFLNCNYLEP